MGKCIQSLLADQQFTLLVTVYIAGSISWAGLGKPYYWIGITPIYLPLSPDTTYGEAQSISVKNSTVYTAGYIENPNTIRIPCYWKDTTLVPLQLPPGSTMAG